MLINTAGVRGWRSEVTWAVCYFPGCLGDTQFSFRFRQSVGRRTSRLRDDLYNRDAPVTLQVRLTWFLNGWLLQPHRCVTFLFCLSERNGAFLRLRLLQTSEGRLCEEGLLPEGHQTHLCSPVFTCSQVVMMVIVIWLCVSVPGAGVKVAIHSPVPLADADHCTWVLWEAWALPWSG